MRSHHSSLSFVTKSQPPEPAVSALEAYRAANPQVKELQDVLLEQFRVRRQKNKEGIALLLFSYVDKAEDARQVGNILLQFADTLAGKRLTRDFYEQCRHLFVDATGTVESFEVLEWYMRVARSCPEPIETIHQASKWTQMLMLASGEPEFRLVSDGAEKQRILPKDELGKLQSWLEFPEVVDVWKRLKANPKYWELGHLRADLAAAMAEEFKPVIAVVDELKAELGL